MEKAAFIFLPSSRNEIETYSPREKADKAFICQQMNSNQCIRMLR